MRWPKFLRPGTVLSRVPGVREAGRGAGRDSVERRGFALVEMMTVLLVAGSVTRIAAPNVEVMLHRARAADILGDVRVVELAALEYNSATRSWPETGEAGKAPDEMAGYLPGDFRFRDEHHTLTWERWELPRGLPGRPDTELLLGITVTIPDEDVGAAVLDMAGRSRARLTVGDHYTFIFAREPRGSSSGLRSGE